MGLSLIHILKLSQQPEKPLGKYGRMRKTYLKEHRPILDVYKRQALELPGLTVSGERMADKAAAKQLKETCRGANVTIKKVECKEKSEKPPALYDLTTCLLYTSRCV